jgi:hypothetical protein
LDAHFLAVFTPADLVGADGHKHESVTVSRGNPNRAFRPDADLGDGPCS